MVFRWGIEVKPGEPYNHTFDKTRRRLYVSQATLGIDLSAAQRRTNVMCKTSVQCKIGDKSPMLLCSLLPDKNKINESCFLNLQLEALDDEVIFSVLGPRSVRLTGFYLGKGQGCCDDTESEWYKTFFAEMNIKEDDPVEDDDPEMFLPPRSNSGEENKAAEEKSDEKIQTESKKKEEDGVHNGAGIKRKIDSITQDGEAERASEKSEDSSKPSTEIGLEKSEKTKKKKKVRA